MLDRSSIYGFRLPLQDAVRHVEAMKGRAKTFLDQIP